MARPSGRHALAALLAGLGHALLPTGAFACPVCYGGSEGPLFTYFVTGVLMSLLPLGMIGVVGLWYLRSTRSRRAERENPVSARPKGATPW